MVSLSETRVVITTAMRQVLATVSAPRSTIAKQAGAGEDAADGERLGCRRGGVVLHSSELCGTWSLAVKEETRRGTTSSSSITKVGWSASSGESGHRRTTVLVAAVNSPVKVSLMAVDSGTSRTAWQWVWRALSWQHTTAASRGRCRRHQLWSTCSTSLDGEKMDGRRRQRVVLTAGAPATDWKPAQSTSQGRGWHTRST